MPLYPVARNREWFTENCTWETYEREEAMGHALSPYFLGGFDYYLHQAAIGLGYPVVEKELDSKTPPGQPETRRCLWGPYQVACAIVEEKRTIRNKAGILFWRPAFVFLGGRTGPRVSDGRHTGFADHKGRTPDMYEASVRAAWGLVPLGALVLPGLCVFASSRP